MSPESGRLLYALVRAAGDYDLYNARCRGFISSSKTSDVNKLFLNKYGITVSDVKRRYASGADLDTESDKADFFERLERIGGCKAAKQQGYADELSTSYQKLLHQVQALP